MTINILKKQKTEFNNKTGKQLSYIGLSVSFHLLLLAIVLNLNTSKTDKSINNTQTISFIDVAPLPSQNILPPQPKVRSKANSTPSSSKVKIATDKTSNLSPQPLKNKNLTSRVVTKSFNKNIINNSPPRYPSAALRNGWQGKVLLSLLIGPNGQTEKVDILLASEFKLLNKSAVRSALKWKFKPDKDGKKFKIKKEIIFAIK